MLTALEQNALEVQMHTLPQINESLTKIAGQLNYNKPETRSEDADDE